MSWLIKALGALHSLLSAVLGDPGQAAAAETLASTQRELDRERRITAALRTRVTEKETRIRELEKLVAERDPGALLDSVFRGPDAPTS